MGTRGLTVVISKGETKVAQYGQWDHYPSGQGATILDFLSTCDIDKLREKINNLRWITDEEAKEIEKDNNWYDNYPYLSRDCGGKILGAIYNGKMEVSAGIGSKKTIDCDVKFLSNSEDFAGDSVFCEWAYVVDLDKNTFEVYKGFNKEPLNENERFYKHFNHPEHRTEVFYPVKFVVSYDLNKLPTEEEFMDFFNKKTRKKRRNGNIERRPS